jgi:dienelactone hydrolase
MFHGCGGNPDQQTYWGNAFKEMGFVGVYIDSYSGRSIDFEGAQTQVCNGNELRGAERASDVLTAIAWANRQPWADKDNIILAGWSHGAWSVMDTFALDRQNTLPHNLNSAPDVDLNSIKQAVLFYPYCGIASKTGTAGWAVNPDILLIEVANDSVVGKQVCDSSFSWIKNSGSQVQHKIFKGVDHAFDTDAVSTLAGRTQRTPIGKAKIALEESKELVTTFLK